MNIQIHSVHFDADKRLLEFIENKVRKLGQLYEELFGAEIFLRLENVQDAENKIAEIKLEIPGNDLFAKKKSKTFEEAIDNAVDALKKQIVKHKEKVRRV